MIAEPNPKFFQVILTQPTMALVAMQSDTAIEYVNIIIPPGPQTLAVQTDDNGKILAPWPATKVVKVEA